MRGLNDYYIKRPPVWFPFQAVLKILFVLSQRVPVFLC